MHLRARSDMTIHIRKAQLTFQIGSSETIKTEDSYKFELDEIRDLSQRCGFRCSEQWVDSEWVDSEWAFAQSLLIAQ